MNTETRIFEETIVPREEPSAASFTVEATGAALGMKKALVDLFATLPTEIRRAKDLERAMNLDPNLAWSLFQVISAPNILTVANRIPKAPSIRRLIRTGEKHGASPEILAALRAASEKFEEVVRTHAKDHITFSSLVAGVAGAERSTTTDLADRRTAFRINTRLWGSQVDTAIAGFISRMKEDGSGFEQLSMNARLGLKRFRPGAHAVAYVHGKPDGPDIPMLPLDQEAHQRHGGFLLPEFSTHPLPQFKRSETVEFGLCYELTDDSVGQNSSVDLAGGHINLPIMLAKMFENRECFGGMRYRIPTAKAILDMVVHRPSFGRVTPKFEAVGMLTDAPREDLPIRAEVVEVVGGIPSASMMEAPRWAALLTYACKIVNWDPTEFDIYRVAVDYPILHSRMSLQFSY